MRSATIAGVTNKADAAAVVDLAVGAEAEVLPFATFYEQNIDGLTRALMATLGDVGLAQDAAQEAMLRACARWSKIGAYRSPFGWCYRVGLNWATSRWRRRRTEDLTGRFDPAAATSELQPRDFALREAVMALPVDWRAVVVLRLWMDWSVEATAEALDVAEGTVRSRLSRAVARLRVTVDDPSLTAGAR